MEESNTGPRQLEDGSWEYDIEVDDEVYAAMEIIAKAAGLTVKEFASAAIKDYLESLLEAEKKEEKDKDV